MNKKNDFDNHDFGTGFTIFFIGLLVCGVVFLFKMIYEYIIMPCLPLIKPYLSVKNIALAMIITVAVIFVFKSLADSNLLLPLVKIAIIITIGVLGIYFIGRIIIDLIIAFKTLAFVFIIGIILLFVGLIT